MTQPWYVCYLCGRSIFWVSGSFDYLTQKSICIDCEKYSNCPEVLEAEKILKLMEGK